MTAWFVRTAESYFARVGKAQIWRPSMRPGDAPAFEKLKRVNLPSALLNSGRIGWLPEPLRLAPMHRRNMSH